MKTIALYGIYQCGFRHQHTVSDTLILHETTLVHNLLTGFGVVFRHIHTFSAVVHEIPCARSHRGLCRTYLYVFIADFHVGLYILHYGAKVLAPAGGNVSALCARNDMQDSIIRDIGKAIVPNHYVHGV